MPRLRALDGVGGADAVVEAFAGIAMATRFAELSFVGDGERSGLTEAERACREPSLVGDGERSGLTGAGRTGRGGGRGVSGGGSFSSRLSIGRLKPGLFNIKSRAS